VWRLGYDGRAWIAQTLLAWATLPLSYFLTDPVENLNWALGPGEKPQTVIPPWLYLVLLMLLFPACIYLPAHLALSRLFPGG
jgi:hypothetical protein